MTRYCLIAILLTVFLAGCHLPLSSQQSGKLTDTGVEAQDLELFIAGIDQFDSSRRSKAFLQLEQDYPESPWNRRAKVLASLAGSIRILEKQLKRQQALIDAQQSDHLTLTKLREENALLHEQVKALKALIVDLELRQP